jgi:hypothetical protein
MSANKVVVLVENNDIRCEKVYQDGIKILSFTFKCKTANKKAMEEMKRVLLAYVKTLEGTTKKFRIFIDVRSIITPSFSMLGEQSGPAKDMEEATYMYVEKTAVVTSFLGLKVLEKNLTKEPPKTSTKAFDNREKAQTWIMS